MTSYKMIVFTQPTTAGDEDDYNQWYDRHLTDVLKTAGVISAQRFGIVKERPNSGTALTPYFAIYDIETDDLAAVMKDLDTRAGTDDMPISPSLDVENVKVSVYRARGPAHTRKG